MPIFIVKDIDILFIHIPKTGGTSIEDLLTRFGWNKEWFGSDTKELNECSPQHRHQELIEKHRQLEKRKIPNHQFTVTRNPIDRLISEYWHNCRESKELYKTLTVQTFDFWFSEIMKLYEKDSCALDNHLRPQVEFIAPETKLFRLETDIDKIPVYLKAIGDNEGFEVPSRDIKHENAGTNKHLVQMTNATFERIKEFYKYDFKVLYPNGDTIFKSAVLIKG